MNRLVAEPDGTVRLYVGAENWPMPIPLVNRKNAWYFDASAGKEEILFRRIGRNEMATIGVLQELVAAQKEYYSKTHDDDGVKQYAQKFVSDQGKHDGLYVEAMSGVSGGVARVANGTGQDASGGERRSEHDVPIYATSWRHGRIVFTIARTTLVLTMSCRQLSCLVTANDANQQEASNLVPWWERGKSTNSLTCL